MADPIRRLLGKLRRGPVTPEPLRGREAFEAYVLRKSGGRVSPPTLQRYVRYVDRFLAWLEGEPVTPAAVDAYHARVLRPRYAQNSRIVMASGLNWYLRYLKARDEDGEPLRFPIPGKEALENPRTVTDEEFSALRGSLRRSGDPASLALLLVLRDTLLRPSDVVSLERGHLDLDGERPSVRKRQVKTRNPVRAFLTAETVRVLKDHLRDRKPERYVFEAAPGKPFHRRWPLEALRRAARRAGLPGDIGPRTFRRTGATNWAGDPKDLQLQGGWKDLKTVFTYRQAREDRHYDAFRRTFEPDDELTEDWAFR